MTLDWSQVLQFALVVPMGYLFVLLRAVQAKQLQILSNVYTKAETDKMIDLKLAPMDVTLKEMKEDIAYIRQHLEKLS